MGRIFETRKATMFKRWDRMAKAFARVSKDIAMAVKSGGPIVDSNPALRRAMQNARAVNMPKDKVEAAIKRASAADSAAYETVMYEGYAPHGVALMIETATDNIVRTVANVRSYFNEYEGNLGANGSVSYLFKHMGVFRLSPEGLPPLDELELGLIDDGLEELGEGTGEKGEKQVVLRCSFADFGRLQAGLEARTLTPVASEFEYVPTMTVSLAEPQATEVLELVDRLEQDDDVQRVFHTLAAA
ncbi:MAG: YebC/PmpR family DNA-binding transcriptional regulator [Archangium sp.]|nr:YebC/PmpR family DNA-binding transcriptional regulator [Archangium sp.]